MKKTIPHFSFFTYRIKIIFPPYVPVKLNSCPDCLSIFCRRINCSLIRSFFVLLFVRFKVFQVNKLFPEMEDIVHFSCFFLALLPSPFFSNRRFIRLSLTLFPNVLFRQAFPRSFYPTKNTRKIGW